MLKISPKLLIVTTVIGLPGAIIGSALWEGPIRPLMQAAGLWLLDLTTFGMTALVDAVYAEIGKGQQEFIAQFLLAFLMGGIAAATTIVFVVYLSVVRDRPLVSAEKFASRVVGRYLVIALLVSSSVFMIFMNRVLYVSYMVGEFNRARIIAAPYVTDLERLQLESENRRMKTKKDAVALLGKLSAIHEKAGLGPLNLSLL